MRRLASVVVWWALLLCLWALYTGTTARLEVLTGLAAAAVAAVAVEVVRAQGLLSFRVDPRLLTRAWKVPVLVVYEFVLITWLLVRAAARRERVNGELIAVQYPKTRGPRGRWERAWETTLTTMTPNAIVVDVDADRGEMLLHTLDADRWQGATPV